jgi:hypothetical protein
MKIRIGYELIYDCPQPTPMILTLSVHYTRVSDIIIPDHLIADPPVPLTAYRDSFITGAAVSSRPRVWSSCPRTRS